MFNMNNINFMSNNNRIHDSYQDIKIIIIVVTLSINERFDYIMII